MVAAFTTYERDVLPFVRPFSDALARSLDGMSMVGISHFDHGSGTGEVLRAIGSPVRAARVVALEPNAAMNERFNEVYGDFENVSLFEGTLDTYLDAYPAESGHQPFDLVTSQLVLPFVADPFREL